MPIADTPRPTAVAGIAQRDRRLLLVRRAQTVVAPGKLCFPGGMCEAHESPWDAIVREFREELDVTVSPVRHLWSSTTPWQVDVDWWTVHFADDQPLTPNASEIDQVNWMSLEEMQHCPDLLQSNRDWLAALRRGEFTLDP